MAKMSSDSSSSSPVKITISSSSGAFQPIGITSPVQRRLSNNPNSPLSASRKGSVGSPISSTSGGRYLSLSKDSVEEFVSYTVQIPQTPDNRILSESLNCSVEGGENKGNPNEVYMKDTIFTGGFNSATKAYTRKSKEEEEEVENVVIKSKFSCEMEGCDEASNDGKFKGECECGFRICKECFLDCVANNFGHCPGCKEPYRGKGDEDYDEESDDEPRSEARDQANPLPCRGGSRMEKNFSLVQSFKNPNSELDNSQWLFETKGTYGYGNALWPRDGHDFGRGGERVQYPPDFSDRRNRPLTRKIGISTAIISPYRLLIVARLAALSCYLTWRVSHPNREAMWLWMMSVICEFWFALSWILDQLPKLCPVKRETDLAVLSEQYESTNPNLRNPKSLSDLPGIDVFVSTADAEKEPPLVTANTILSILAVNYPVEKVACYLSDDGGSLVTFEALAEAASFAKIWVPFCRKHKIEPRNPEAYFGLKRDPLKNQKRVDFVADRRRVKREYDEYKVRINALPDSIRRRSDAYNAKAELRAKKKLVELGDNPVEPVKKATWMVDGTHWPGTWASAEESHTRGDHEAIIQMMLVPPNSEPLMGAYDDCKIDTSAVDVRLPMLVYVSREKRPGFDHNKKAGAMNALVRASAIMSNGPFILNLDCDHYIYNSLAMREGMCFMLDRGGDRIGYVQFPQRFEGIDPSDRYANHNTVFFDVSMRALDGLQGPMYVGTGCIFRRIAVYGFSPPRATEHLGWFGRRKKRMMLLKRSKDKDAAASQEDDEMMMPIMGEEDHAAEVASRSLLTQQFGNSTALVDSIAIAEFGGRLLHELRGKGCMGRPSGSLAVQREPLDASALSEAVSVITCFYEDKSDWGKRVGWIYGSVTEDVVTGYRMHNRGWRSIYCVTKRDAFRGTAPINLTDRLNQVLRWATGSVEIFFSRNNALFASPRMKFLQRVAYFNVGIYPFTSMFLLVYCTLPALSLFSGKFIVQSLNITFLVFLLIITLTLCFLALLEIKWSGISLQDWWRNEQFWVIGGTSAHPAAVIQGLLKVIAGIDISFTLTSKSAAPDDGIDDYAELYEFRWTILMIPPITIILLNVFAMGVAISRTMYSPFPQWSKLLGGVFFSFWVLAHLFPFAKGFLGRKGKIPTIVYLWSGLIGMVLSLLALYVYPPPASGGQSFLGSFQFP
ncbi:hypothetical protein Leryth_004737 [Lithospermum erythrorhizon]|nr:hypothetical protein Leryth_004737 [Lithospermum erythrorhizon]